MQGSPLPKGVFVYRAPVFTALARSRPVHPLAEKTPRSSCREALLRLLQARGERPADCGPIPSPASPIGRLSRLSTRSVWSPRSLDLFSGYAAPPYGTTWLLHARLPGRPEQVLGGQDKIFSGVAAVGVGDWKRAAALFTTLARVPNVPTRTRYLLALASLKAGDPAGYRAACSGIGPQVSPVGPQLSGGVAYDAAMVFTLGPNATDDWTQPLAWIDHCLTRLGAYEKAHPDRKGRIASGSEPRWNCWPRSWTPPCRPRAREQDRDYT